MYHALRADAGAGLTSIWHAVFWVLVLVAFAFLANSWLRLRRAEFIRTYQWPPGLLRKLVEHHLSLSRNDAALVSCGLRQFFIAHLMSGRRFVSMPSRVADDLWHEFILSTRDYQRFCRKAFRYRLLPSFEAVGQLLQ